METMDYEGIREYIGIAKRTIQKWVHEGDFPPPIKLSQKSVIFDKADIVKWLESKKEFQQGEAENL